MANFTTHIGVGTVASGLLATLTLAADVVAPENLVAVTLAGVLGSVLPDIDLKDSRAGRAMFSGLAAFFSFATLFNFAEKLSIAELWLLAAAVFLLVRFVAYGLFHRMSYHRGIYHSVLASVLFALLTAVVYKHVLGRHDGVAWLAAGFMFIGCIIHLILDEVFSVDVTNTRVKRSFGSALKLIDTRRLDHSAAMAVVTSLVFLATPPTGTFVEGISSRAMWAGLQQKLLPRDKWFGLIGESRHHVGEAGQAAAIETGALPSRPSAQPSPTSERKF